MHNNLSPLGRISKGLEKIDSKIHSMLDAMSGPEYDTADDELKAPYQRLGLWLDYLAGNITANTTKQAQTCEETKEAFWDFAYRIYQLAACPGRDLALPTNAALAKDLVTDMELDAYYARQAYTEAKQFASVFICDAFIRLKVLRRYTGAIQR